MKSWTKSEKNPQASSLNLERRRNANVESSNKHSIVRLRI
jgi:hypothetical protein